MPQTKQIVGPSVYASSDDFCQIFRGDMNSLYLLSFLLTADREKAEQCFVSGLEDAVEGNPVFKEWAHSWARRAIIRNAVRVIEPRPVEGRGASIPGSDKTRDLAPAAEPMEIAAILTLRVFERFVYVITVLEHYSDYECSLLLGCTRRDVLSARTRALRQIAGAMDVQQTHPPASSRDRSVLRERGSVLELLLASRLATSS